MESLIEFLEAELVRRSWRQADLARATRVPDATIHHILNGSRRAGPEVCNALARALDEPPERIFRMAGLLPPLLPAVDEEQEAVRILRGLSPDLRVAVLLQDLRRDVSDDERLLIDWLAEREVPVVVALTKIDKLKPMRRAARVKELRAQLALSADRVVPTSAEKGLGVGELWRAIDAQR